MQTASWGRRLLALSVDWFASIAVVVLLIGVDGWLNDPLSGLWTSSVFVVESAVLTAFAGGSFGKMVTGLRTVRLADRRPVGLGRALLRQLLVALVIPPLVFRPDRRGLHDLAVGSATVRVAEVTR